MFWRKKKKDYCIPEYLAYSILNELREKAPLLTNSVEIYAWLVKGETYPNILIRSVAEALRCAYETLSEDDFLHFSTLLIMQLTFGNHTLTYKIRDFLKAGKYDSIDAILCIKNRVVKVRV